MKAPTGSKSPKTTKNVETKKTVKASIKLMETEAEQGVPELTPVVKRNQKMQHAQTPNVR